MDLSLGMLSAVNSHSSQSGRMPFARDITQLPGSTDSAATPATEESTTERPVRESSQPSQLSPEEQAQVRELQQRDREVRAHEAAHRAAAGGMVSGGSYTYQTGPDGRNYAVGGEVSISAAHASTPQEQLRQAETIRRAALAPADPSPQDRMVAAQASATAYQARGDIRAEQQQEMTERKESKPAGEESEDIAMQELPVLNRRAIAAFSGIQGTLHSTPSTIDEII